jgi:hypothetical protein
MVWIRIWVGIRNRNFSQVRTGIGINSCGSGTLLGRLIIGRLQITELAATLVIYFYYHNLK